MRHTIISIALLAGLACVEPPETMPEPTAGAETEAETEAEIEEFRDSCAPRFCCDSCGPGNGVCTGCSLDCGPDDTIIACPYNGCWNGSENCDGTSLGAGVGCCVGGH